MNAAVIVPALAPSVERIPVERLVPAPRNARTHSREQIKAIARSIEEFGFVNPVLIDEGGQILAGHGRVAAAKLLGTDKVPVVRIEHLSPEQKRAYVLADNRLAERAGWDKELLAIELQGLVELDFPVDVIGFEPAEIEIILSDHGADRGGDDDPGDELEAPRTDAPPITRPGDLWELGEHRLLCGDATKEADYAALLKDERVRMVITDPPYNVRVNGHVATRGRHREFKMASGEMSAAEFAAFLKSSFAAMAAVSEPGAIHYIFMDWRHLREALTAGDAAYDELLNIIVWNKVTPGMGSFQSLLRKCVVTLRRAPRALRGGIDGRRSA